MRYVCLLTLMIPILFAQDGATIYKERCAGCHDAPAIHLTIHPGIYRRPACPRSAPSGR